jgi:sigma-B regulation protein RsbU (phosphoserine phosphatase)
MPGVPPVPSVKPGPPLPSEILGELLPLVREINAVLDPEALLPAIATQLRRIVDFRLLDIFLPGPDGLLYPAFVEGYPQEDARRFRLKLGEGIVGTAAETREPIFVPDVTSDPRYISWFPGVKAELAIPLVNKDRLVGVLNIEGPDVEAFTPDAQTALRVLAGHLASAIDNATLYKEARWYADLLGTLFEIGKETASILDLDLLLQRVGELVRRVIDYDFFAILLVDEDRQELVLRQQINFGAAREKWRLPISEGLSGAAVRSKEPVRVGDVRKDPRYVSLIPEARSELVVPLVHNDRVVGVFDLESPVLDRFNEEHVKVLTPLASQVAIAIENARLWAELKRNERRLQRELRIARDIQRALFPEESPAGRGWEASAQFRPARELGGDLYDFYDMGSGILGVSTGDVAGKGVPAALYAAFASGAVRSRAFERRTPADLMTRVNRTLNRRGIEGLFCTLGYALFDFPAKSLRVANSGLPYPLLYRAATGRCTAVEVGGLPLGTFDSSTYDELTIELGAGDVFVFHTDGVMEARVGAEDYGTARLMATVEKLGTLPAPRIAEGVLEDLEAFMGDNVPADDVTLIVVKVL